MSNKDISIKANEWALDCLAMTGWSDSAIYSIAENMNPQKHPFVLMSGRHSQPFRILLSKYL